MNSKVELREFRVENDEPIAVCDDGRVTSGVPILLEPSENMLYGERMRVDAICYNSAGGDSDQTFGTMKRHDPFLK